MNAITQKLQKIRKDLDEVIKEHKDKQRYNPEAMLCMFKDGIAYFSNVKPIQESGDDWEDVPYEHNAGKPHRGITRYAVVVVWTPQVIEPYCEPRTGYANSPYSVNMINKNEIAWLIFPGSDGAILPRTLMGEFINTVEQHGYQTVWYSIK